MRLRLVSLLLAFVLATPALATPALWQVEGKGARFTLYGTIHALPAGQEWFSPAAQAAFTAADTLVVEVADGGDPAAMGALVQRVGMLPAPVPLGSRVPPDLRPLLDQTLRLLGLPAASLDSYETWLATLNIVMVDTVRSGLDPGAGVDRALMAMAKTARKPIVGLETTEFQLGLFDALPEAEQRLLLGSAIADSGALQDEVRALLKAWLAGDVERIRAEFEDGGLSVELEQALLVRRNTAWADWVAARAAGTGGKSGTMFIAVGAAHMAGTDSLIALLKARGFAVRRVE